MKTEILYEDNSILVIRKPAGLAVQSAGIGQPDVVSELKSYLAKLPSAGRPGKGEPYLGIVHRLDQPVEGLLVFAKDKKAAAALSKQLTEGALNKHYYAVLCGGSDRQGAGICRCEDCRAALSHFGRDQRSFSACACRCNDRDRTVSSDPGAVRTCGISIAGRYEVWNGSAKRGDACAEISRRGTMRVLSGACPSHFREKDGIPGSAEESGICRFCDEGIEKTHRK